MKKLMLPIVIFAALLMLSACQQVYPFSNVTRDDEMTGGSLDFSYNKSAQIIEFGGEDQLVQFYAADIAKGWEEEGCRVGAVFHAPSEVEDYDSGNVWVDGKKMAGGEFYSLVNGKKMGKVVLTPLVSEEKREVEVKFEWTDNSKAQVYKIKIKEGTKFMEKSEELREI